MIAKRLSAAFALAAALAVVWSPSPNLFAQEPAPIGLDPPAVPAGSNSAAPSEPPSADPAAAPSVGPPATGALDPAVLPPSSSADPLLLQTTPAVPSLNPLTVPPGGVDPNALPPTAPAASLPPSSTAPLPSGAADPFSAPPGGRDPFAPSTGGVDPFAANPAGPADPYGPNPVPTSRPGGQKADAPKLAAKFLLLQSDWGKATDRARASEIARSLTNGPYELSDADDSILRQGNAAMFQRDGATQLVADLASLGLVRQSLDVQPFELKELKDDSLVALGAVTATFSVPIPPPDGSSGSASEAWTFLVVGQAYPADGGFSGFSSTLAPAVSAAKVWIIGWRTTEELTRSSGDLSDATAPPSKPGERYVGFFVVSSDQSALVPLRLPGIEGLTILFAPTVDAPLVRPLGPSGPRITWQPLQLDASVDTAEVIRAYESSPASKTTPTIGPPQDDTGATGSLSENEPKEGYTIHLRSAAAGDLIRLEQALRESDLSVDVLSVQYQGTGGHGTIEIQAPADSANELYDLTKKTLPISTAQIVVQRRNPPADEATDSSRREAVSLSWSPATEDQAEALEKALLASDLNIGIVSVQFQGDRASMQVETNVGSAPAVIDLVKKTLPEAKVRDEGVERLAEEEPQSEEPETASETVAFYLKYVQASEAAKVLNSLKRDDEIRIAVDERTNLLLVQAPPETKYLRIAEITELLKLLDSAPDEAPARPTPSATVDRSADIATLRTDLERVERQVKAAAAQARSLSGAERDEKVRSLRERVTEAFRLRLDLQREEAAELRDRLAKIESNLERRRRVEGAVVDRRIDVLLDPALEWPDLSLDEASPATPSSIPRTPSAPMSSAAPSDFGSSFSGAPSLPELASGDSFSAATTLAMGIARLNDELATLTRNGAPPDSELRLSLIQRQLDLLRQEFDARHQALEQELQAAKSKLRAAQTTWERLSTLRDTGAVSAEEADRAQTDLETAQAELARQEILLQQYEQAKSGLPPASVPAELDQQRLPAAQGSASPTSPSAGGWFNEDLQGTWKIVRWAARGGDLDLGTKELVWSFYGNYVQNPGGIWLFVTDESVSPMGLRLYPSEMRLDDQGPFQNTGQPLRYVYEVEGDRLRLAVRNGRGLPTEYPAELAPTDDVEYLELQRVGNASPIKPPVQVAAAPPLQDDGSVPQELQGVWNVVRSVTNGQELDLSTTDGDWRFYGPYAFARTKDSSQDLTTIYRVVVDPSSTPKRMEMHPIAMPFEDYAHIQDIKPGRYLYEVEGDRLRLAARAWKEDPENAYPADLAPGEGVHYMELERVGDADAFVPVDEGAPAGDRENWTRSTRPGLDHPSQRRDDQFAIATSLALRRAELSRRIKTLEKESEASRDQGELDSAKASLDLLRQEFDARENAAKRDFATAAESVAIAEGRLQAAQKLHERQGSPPNDGNLIEAHSAAQDARDQAKFLEALLGHYDRARKTVEPSPSGASSMPGESATSLAPPELQGRWRVTHQTARDRDDEMHASWTFVGDKLTVKRVGFDDVTYDLAFPPESPSTFLTYRSSDGSRDDEIAHGEFAGRYRVDGDRLRISLGSGDGRSLPDSAAFERGSPSGFTTLEFVREAEAPWVQGSIPELEGRWRLTDRPVQGITWTFADGRLIVERKGEERRVSPLMILPGSPGRFRVPGGIKVRQGDVDAEYRFERDGDRLRVLGGAVVGPLFPEEIAPAQGFTYAELERITDDAEPTSPTPDESASTPSTQALQGTWRLVRQSLGDDPLAIRAETTWTFDGDTLTETQTPQGGEPAAFEFRIEHSTDVPGGFTRIGTSPPWQGARRLARYQLQGSKLQVKMRDSPEATTFPDQAAPDGQDYYLEFERVAEPKVPPELIGTWRLARYTVESAPEAKVTFTKWTFDETTLGMDTPKGEHRYEVTSSPDSPGKFQTYKFHEVPAGLALEGDVLRVRYVVEAEGDRLKVAFGGGAGPPDEVAPDQGVIYYEFDRISRGSRPVTDVLTDDAGALSVPAEDAVGP